MKSKRPDLTSLIFERAIMSSFQRQNYAIMYSNTVPIAPRETVEEFLEHSKSPEFIEKMDLQIQYKMIAREFLKWKAENPVEKIRGELGIDNPVTDNGE